MNSTYPQIPLLFRNHQAFTFENFVAGVNQPVIAQLDKQLSAEGEQLLYLWGSQGAGCSHLLQAACQRASLQERTAIYLPMDEMSKFEPAVLEGVDEVDLVCLDHLEAIAGQADWEQALFHLFNRIAQRNGALLVAAGHPPRTLGVQLADLLSRLSSCAVFQVALLDDKHKITLLQDKAAHKGIELSAEAAQFILNRGERSIDGLLQILDELDQLSLSAGRKLTIPFIKKTMNW